MLGLYSNSIIKFDIVMLKHWIVPMSCFTLLIKHFLLLFKLFFIAYRCVRFIHLFDAFFS